MAQQHAFNDMNRLMADPASFQKMMSFVQNLSGLTPEKAANANLTEVLNQCESQLRSGDNLQKMLELLPADSVMRNFATTAKEDGMKESGEAGPSFDALRETHPPPLADSEVMATLRPASSSSSSKEQESSDASTSRAPTPTMQTQPDWSYGLS